MKHQRNFDVKVLILQAKKIIQNSKNIIVFTGAGISTESEIPDFRSPGGLWSKFDPEIYANFDVFIEKPEKYWEMQKELDKIIEKAKPNKAHDALVQFEKKGTLKGIITQNIDNLHYLAGTKVPIFELHGSLAKIYCIKCGNLATNEELNIKLSQNTVPHCDECGGLLKPNIILFNEALPMETFFAAENATENCDCFIIIGSSLSIAPANEFPLLAKQIGAKIIIINKNRTMMDDLADIIIHGLAGEILSQILF